MKNYDYSLMTSIIGTTNYAYILQNELFLDTSPGKNSGLFKLIFASKFLFENKAVKFTCTSTLFKIF